MVQFTSDNVTPTCPEVMEALVIANVGASASYGNDQWSQNLQDKFSELFETDVAVFPTVTGTASNALALSALTPAFGKIYCHELAHINTDECGAPELFTGGAKLIPMSGPDAKISAEILVNSVHGSGNVHHAQPACVSMTQACETGAVYQLEEIRSIADTSHALDMKVHMDGARFANAIVSLNTTPAEMTWKAGVDALSFGGTKNGCLAAEAVVFFDCNLAKNFQYLHKRSGQLLSKMRFISAQLDAYISNDVWLSNARHANTMADYLSQGLTCLGIELAYMTQSNEVFVHLSEHVVRRLKQHGFDVNDEELDGSFVRFVTAWNTEQKDIDRLLAEINAGCAR